jgi:hypothetical protein
LKRSKVKLAPLMGQMRRESSFGGWRLGLPARVPSRLSEDRDTEVLLACIEPVVDSPKALGKHFCIIDPYH